MIGYEPRGRGCPLKSQIAKGNLAAGLTHNQLRRRRVDRAAGAQAEHRVKASRTHVGRADRDRADHAKTVDLADQRPKHPQRQLGLRRLQAQQLWVLAVGGAASGCPASFAPIPLRQRNSSPAPKS